MTAVATQHLEPPSSAPHLLAAAPGRLVQREHNASGDDSRDLPFDYLQVRAIRR
jgi:hypothetical protein